MNPGDPENPGTLTIEDLARIQNLEYRAGFFLNGFLNGRHENPCRGTNTEFKEHREYAAGDEIRNIDWKIYGRTDRLHVRVHEEDTNLNAYLILDRSASMNFQSANAAMNKFDYARFLAAVLLLILQRQSDGVSLIPLGNTNPGIPEPSTKRTRMEDSMLELNRLTPDATDCNWDALQEILSMRLRPESAVFLISDLYRSPSEFFPLFDLFRRKRCEFILCHVWDPMERDFTGEETLLLQDNESGKKLSLTPELIREAYRKRTAEHRTGLAETAAAYHGEYLFLPTDRLPLDLLSLWMKMRNSRKRRNS